MLARLCSKYFKLGFSSTVNLEIPDVQAGFRKHRGTRDQIASIRWIIEKAREFQEKSTTTTTKLKPLTVDHNKLENSSSNGNTTPP